MPTWVERREAEDGGTEYVLTMDLPDDFALDQPLSPFLLAALELLDPESETYALDAVSMVEATLENPRQVLRAQERKARDKAMAEMKMDGVDYDERVERIAEVTYPEAARGFAQFRLRAVLREGSVGSRFRIEPQIGSARHARNGERLQGLYPALGNLTFRGHSASLFGRGVSARSIRTVPIDKRDEQMKDIIAWLGLVVSSVDSSLVDEWANAGASLDAAPPEAQTDAVVRDRRGLTVLVRNALISRVRVGFAWPCGRSGRDGCRLGLWRACLAGGPR